MSQRYAPSVRVENRDAKWRIKSIDHTSDGGELLPCEGMSGLVRDREATFLTKTESNIRALAPENTVLGDDTSSTCYEQNDRIIFTPSKEIVDAGLPCTVLDNGITDRITTPVRAGHACEHAPVEPVRADHVRDNASEQAIALGWSDIQHLTAGDSVSKTHTDTTQATDPVERTIIYEAPFFKPNRAEDYATAWAFFEKHV